MVYNIVGQQSTHNVCSSFLQTGVSDGQCSQSNLDHPTVTRDVRDGRNMAAGARKQRRHWLCRPFSEYGTTKHAHPNILLSYS